MFGYDTVALSAAPDLDRISDTLADMDEQTRAGTALLVSVARERGVNASETR